MNARVQMLLVIGASALVGALTLTNAHAQQVPLPKTAADVPGPAQGPMTKAYVQMVGRMAYVYGWPLVYVHNQRTQLTKVPETGLLGGAMPISPMNQVGMLTGYISPGERFIGDPNQDVVYGLGYLSLAKEPVVIQVPDFGNRFWTVPVYDARTDQASELGQQYGTKPGFYMVVGPNWKGATPAGIAGVVRSSTHFAVTMPRIFMNDSPEDQAAIQPALSQILLYPLSQFDGKMKSKDWSKLPTFPVPKDKSPSKYSSTGPPWVDPATFFDQLPTVMKEVPPMPGEEALYNWIGSVLDAAAKDPEVMKTLQETALAADQELVAPMMRWRVNGQPAGNGWTSPANNGAFGTDYIHRMGAVKADPYDNKRNETMYFYTDTQLQQLAGESSYAITFPKGQLPPVKGFWSLTMYDPEHFFAPNALKRYALGTKNKSLKYNPDGGLTIYLGNKSPGKEKESNWLPAPAGEFSIWLRAYWPDQAILDGTWKPPAIELVK